MPIYTLPIPACTILVGPWLKWWEGIAMKHAEHAMYWQLSQEFWAQPWQKNSLFKCQKEYFLMASLFMVELNVLVNTQLISADTVGAHIEPSINSVARAWKSCSLIDLFNLFNIPVMSQVSPPLPQGVGYGVVIGVGLAFAAGQWSSCNSRGRYQPTKGMMVVTRILKKTVGEDNSKVETYGHRHVRSRILSNRK